MSNWVGTNEIELNEATMKVAIQYWLDNKVLNKDEMSPKVESVKSSNTAASCQTFVVKLKDAGDSPPC